MHLIREFLHQKGSELLIVFFISVFLLLVMTKDSDSAVCRNAPMNPITDIRWDGIFPIRVGGITLMGTDIKTRDNRTGSPICTCGIRIGLRASFWEPARITETVKNAYCFPTLGIQLANPSRGFLDGGLKKATAGDVAASSVKVQTHHYIFPVWAILDLFTDIPCLTEESFDIAYISEIDPTHNNCLLAFILNPEALLFGSPAAHLACAADSIAINEPGRKLSEVTDHLFWCIGGKGSVYPLCGTTSNTNYVEANAKLAARNTFKLGRVGLLKDTGVDYCGAVVTPIWNKSNYRFQISKPVRGRVVPIGTSGHLWASGKNPPFQAGGNKTDNFSWIMFRKQKCCMYFF